MNELTKFLVEGILNETTEKVVALFGGGFKPPTKGHLEVVNNGIKQNPEVTEVKILVGGGARKSDDIITQDQAVKIWNLYNDIGLKPYNGLNRPIPTDMQLQMHTQVQETSNIVHNNRFADHHRYTQQEIINIINHAVKLGADAIVTTEKDAVRFPFIERIDIPLLYMRVEIEMITGEEEFISWIDRICFKSSKIN